MLTDFDQSVNPIIRSSLDEDLGDLSHARALWLSSYDNRRIYVHAISALNKRIEMWIYCLGGMAAEW
jgi:hypothetical protein